MGDSVHSELLKKIGQVVGEETGELDVQLTVDTVADDVAGWDSVAHSRIMLRLEEVFDVKIEDRRMYSFQNVGELADYLGELITAGRQNSALVPEPDNGHQASADDAGSASDYKADTIDEPPPSAMRDPVYSLFSTARYPAPYSMFHDRPADQPNSLVDRFGFFNSAAPVMPKPVTEKRVFVFGNSTIRGGAIIDAMQSHVAENGRADIRIYNFGAISSISYQALMYFIWQGVDLEPDLVVTFDGYLDLGHQPMGYDPRPGYPYNQYMLELIHEYMGRGAIRELDFPRAERERRDVLRRNVGWKTPKWREELALSYLNGVQKFHEICSCYKVPIHSYLQPTLAYKNSLVGKEKVRAAKEIVAHTRHTYALAREGFKALAKKFKLPRHSFADFSAMFEADEKACFTDMVHLEKECYVGVGARLAKDLLQRI